MKNGWGRGRRGAWAQPGQDPWRDASKDFLYPLTKRKVQSVTEVRDPIPG